MGVVEKRPFWISYTWEREAQGGLCVCAVIKRLGNNKIGYPIVLKDLSFSLVGTNGNSSVRCCRSTRFHVRILLENLLVVGILCHPLLRKRFRYESVIGGRTKFLFWNLWHRPNLLFGVIPSQPVLFGVGPAAQSAGLFRVAKIILSFDLGNRRFVLPPFVIGHPQFLVVDHLFDVVCQIVPLGKLIHIDEGSHGKPGGNVFGSHHDGNRPRHKCLPDEIRNVVLVAQIVKGKDDAVFLGKSDATLGSYNRHSLRHFGVVATASERIYGYLAPYGIEPSIALRRPSRTIVVHEINCLVLGGIKVQRGLVAQAMQLGIVIR
mmetsp:Transcript_20938/g.43113  ORF Transcript_20938/g.43113 Transcript_20938/m.43113 type:complete len:320 (-) Transcript_20938:403-1362(-)